MSHFNRLIKNILSNYAGVLIPSAIVLFLTPFMIRTLGATSYGIWIIAVALRSYFQLMEFGIRTSLIKFTSQYHAREEKKEIEELFSTSFFLFFGLGIISIISIKVFANYAPDIFKIPYELFETTKILITIFGFNVAVILLNRILEGMLIGFQRYDLVSILNIISETLNAVLTVLLLLLGFRLIPLSVLSLFLSVSLFFAQLIILRSYYSIEFKIKRFNWQAIRKIVDFSFFSFFLDTAAKVSDKMDSFIIGIFMPVQAITVYIIGVKLASITSKLTDPMIDIFFPFSSELSANKDRLGLQRLLIEGTKLSALISFPLIGFLFLSGEAVIYLWVGEGYQSSVIILRLFLLIATVSILEATSGRILLGIGQLRFNAIVSVLATLLNLILSIILIKPLGLIGVATGTLIPLTIANIFLIIPYTCTKLDLPVKELIRKSLIPTLVPLIPVLSILYLLNYFVNFSAFNKLFVNAVVMFPFYLAVFFKFCLASEEKKFYLDKLKVFLKGERIFSFFSKQDF